MANEKEVCHSCFAGTIFSSQRARPPAVITAAVKRPVRQFLTSGDADQQVSDDGTFPDGKFAEMARARIKTHEHKDSEQQPQTKVSDRLHRKAHG